MSRDNKMGTTSVVVQDGRGGDFCRHTPDSIVRCLFPTEELSVFDHLSEFRCGPRQRWLRNYFVKPLTGCRLNAQSCDPPKSSVHRKDSELAFRFDCQMHDYVIDRVVDRDTPPLVCV